MNIKNLVAVGFVALVIPLVSQAQEVTIQNDTDSYCTALFTSSINTKVCSSQLGGYIDPHKTMAIDSRYFSFVCHGASECDVDLFTSKDCSQPKLGVARISLKEGILNIVNESSDYQLNWDNSHVTITKLSSGLRDWLKSIFKS